MGDLHDALVECRQKLDGAEKLLRCATPTGEACEREKQNFSATIAGSKASVDVVKSIFNKLQESERTGLEKSSELCTNVEGSDIKLIGFLYEFILFRCIQVFHTWSSSSNRSQNNKKIVIIFLKRSVSFSEDSCKFKCAVVELD